MALLKISRVILSAAIPATVAVLVAVFAHGRVSNLLVQTPLPVMLVEKAKEHRPRQTEEEEELELLKDSAWGTAQRDNNEAPPPPPPRYCRQDQIWDDWNEDYVEYEPQLPRVEYADDELLYWFKVYARRCTASKDERPSISVEVFSQSLINFLRSVLGSSSTFSSRPVVDVHLLFRFQDMFSNWLQRLDPFTLQALDLKAKAQIATDTGLQDIQYDEANEDVLLQHFESVRKQLNEFVDWLKMEFEPIQEEVATYLAHGHITFGHLGYVIKPGTKILLRDDEGDKIAVRMTSSEYMVENRTRVYYIHGEGYIWNGTKYDIVQKTRRVLEWHGTQSISSLPWSILSAEDEQELTERGRIYCQYSGIFHVYNNGPMGGKGRAIVDNRSRGEDGAEDDNTADVITFPEDNLCLLPSTVEGFMLRAKKWVNMRVLALRPVDFDHNAWDHLVLDPDTKLLIRSLVDVTSKGTGRALVSDVITGKGGGLVAVLHGKPGTGKTLTAEAVAEHLERPLYMVGSEELPAHAGSLESSLRAILSRSTRWDAVLLIDEADVFLEQRSLHELERNAIVSVALRLLEYHTGVLFLTTNRIKAFDEAFLSRFSIGIRYPDLNRASRLKIWRSFLQLAEVTIVDDIPELTTTAIDGRARIYVQELERLAEKNFNGRSIKNLVRTSQALALANNEALAIEHLNIVARTSERFLEDFEDIHGLGA